MTLRALLLPVLLISAASVLPFLPVLDAGFVNWDDDQNFVTNEHYRGLSLEHLRWMFTTLHYGGYHPLSWLSVALDHAVWGMDPRGYHLTNLLLHAANTLLLFGLLCELARTAAQRLAGHVVPAATGAALLFAVHPLRVETVAWITERRALLACGFLLGTVWCYLRAHRLGARRAWVLQGMAVLAYAGSLLSKGMAVTLPVLLLLLDAYPLHRLRRWSDLLPRTIEKLPYFALAAGVGYLARLAQQEGDAVRSLAEHGPLGRIAQAAYALCFYLLRTVWPADLCALHPLERALNATEPRFLLAFGGVLAITAAALWLRRRVPVVLAGWSSYVLILLPVSGVVQSGPQLVAERYAYLASLPLAALTAAALSRAPRRVWLPLVAAVAVLFGVLSYRQCGVWHDSVRLWTRVVAVHPDGIQGQFNLANALRLESRHDAAARHYAKVTEFVPRHGAAWYYLGLSLLQQKRNADAAAALRRAHDLAADGYWVVRPRSVEVRYCLGLAHHLAGQDGDAVEHLQVARRLDPSFAPTYTVLGSALRRLGRGLEAEQVLRAGRAIAPPNGQPHDGRVP
ncbi:MAG: tetratricopeptide repeat protein [Planctomycetes bacterium]|nr:tetratricopeptide repeat protein [Planctomycetota bacterium]MCB9889124.1 tetratricopeptide repeat protein [Planctomycetota bacterium]